MRKNILTCNYLHNFDTEEFKDKIVLYLGCYTGGRLLNWLKKFGFIIG